MTRVGRGRGGEDGGGDAEVEDKKLVGKNNSNDSGARRALVRLVFFFAAATDGWRSCDVLWEGAAKKRAHLVTDGSGAEAMQRNLQARKKEGKALRAGQREAGGDECGGAA